MQDLPLTCGENLASVLFGCPPSDGAVFLTINIGVLDREFDNYVCAHVDTPQLLVTFRALDLPYQAGSSPSPELSSLLGQSCDVFRCDRRSFRTPRSRMLGKANQRRRHGRRPATRLPGWRDRESVGGASPQLGR